MTAARRRALLLILVAGAFFGALAIFVARPSPRLAPAEKPRLLLLTSLPLVFSDDFGLEGAGSRAYTELAKGYDVLPISTTAPVELGRGRLLLMAQPPAQTAENLVALDDWVRAGGRVMLLADPLLEWPSSRPLGDPLRPLPMFMDTGLLQHWTLRLASPKERGPQMRRLGGYEVMTASSGSLTGGCEIITDRLTARCRVGEGRATIVADADFLDLQHLDGPTDSNVKGLLGELANLRQE